MNYIRNSDSKYPKHKSAIKVRPTLDELRHRISRLEIQFSSRLPISAQLDHRRNYRRRISVHSKSLLKLDHLRSLSDSQITSVPYIQFSTFPNLNPQLRIQFRTGFNLLRLR